MLYWARSPFLWYPLEDGGKTAGCHRGISDHNLHTDWCELRGEHLWSMTTKLLLYSTDKSILQITMIRSYQLTRQVQIKQIMYRVHPITAIRPHIDYISISRALLQIYTIFLASCSSFSTSPVIFKRKVNCVTPFSKSKPWTVLQLNRLLFPAHFYWQN